MKVEIFFNFTNGELEDFSNDKVNIEMSYKEYDYLLNVLIHDGINNKDSQKREESWNMYHKLREFITTSKFK